MKCKCGYENNLNAKFCSGCGIVINNENQKKIVDIPKMLTIKESHELVFKKKISLSKIYELVRTRSLPHVNARGKILLDLDQTIIWWNESLKNSTKPVKLSGLRKIM